MSKTKSTTCTTKNKPEVFIYNTSYTTTHVWKGVEKLKKKEKKTHFTQTSNISKPFTLLHNHQAVKKSKSKTKASRSEALSRL